MKKIFTYLVFFLFGVVYSQNETPVSLNWSQSSQYLSEGVFFSYPHFNYDYFDIDIPNKTIAFKYSFKSNGIIRKSSIVITNVKYEVVSLDFLRDLDFSKLPNKLEYSIETVKAKEDFYSLLKLSPIIIENGVIKRISSFKFNYDYDHTDDDNET